MEDNQSKTPLDKEAGFLDRFIRNADDVLGPGRGTGRFINNVEEQVPIVDERKVNFYSPEEVVQINNKEKIEEGTGGIIGDALFNGIKLFVPQNMKGKIDEGLIKTKNVLEDVDTKLAQPIAGNDPGSWRGKFFSTPTGKSSRGHVVGEMVDENGYVDHLYRGAGGEDRRASLFAPIKNTTQTLNPFLAAAYVGDKMYGDVEQPKQAEETNEEISKVSENISNDYEKHGILEEENLALQLDKEASMQKIAFLEDELEKYAAEMEGLREDVELLTKQASWEREQKEQVQSRLTQSNQTLIEKTAAYEEFRLRTIARQRSEAAVKTAEAMLEAGMIKQAEFDTQVDKLMECDDETFNLYTSLSKEARNDEEGLESLAFLVDYRSNDIDSTPSTTQRGTSKGGQSIGQAARDLIK